MPPRGGYEGFVLPLSLALWVALLWAGRCLFGALCGALA